MRTDNAGLERSRGRCIRVQERQGFPGSDSGRVATVMIGGVHTTTLFVLQPLSGLILLLKRVKILSGDR